VVAASDDPLVKTLVNEDEEKREVLEVKREVLEVEDTGEKEAEVDTGEKEAEVGANHATLNNRRGAKAVRAAQAKLSPAPLPKVGGSAQSRAQATQPPLVGCR